MLQVLVLKEHVNSFIIIPNDKLRKLIGDRTRLMEAFDATNDFIYK